MPIRGIAPSYAAMRLLIFLTVAWLSGTPAFGETPTAAPVDRVATAQGLSELIQDLAIAHLPHNYENTKHWGRTTEIWDGLRISRDGLRIKTKRRKKQANHGTWKRYNAWLVDPDHHLKIVLRDLQPQREGPVTFDLVIDAKLGAFGRLSEWRYDVQLYSFGANAEATVRLTLDCELGFAWKFTHFPPDLMLAPIVHDAQLELRDFRLIRVSDLSGPLIKKLGRSLHDDLQREVDAREGKLVRRINEQISKEQDRLRFSMYEIMPWGTPEEWLKETGIQHELP